MKWNKISDGLPPIGYPVIVTIKDNLRKWRGNDKNSLFNHSPRH